MEMTKEVIEVPFEGVAVRKLHDLFERGYTVCGVAIQRPSLVADADRGAITTHGMVMWWPPEQHKIEQVPAPKNLYEITGNVADVNTVLIERSELRRLHEENQTLREKNGLLKYALTEHETLQAENAELEAMLDAVGAGGVGQSIRPSAIDAIRLAESTFRAYGDHHAAKPDDEKAQRNYQLAEQMRAALLAAVPDAPQPPAAQQEPVAWIEHEWSGTGLRHLHFEKREPMVRDEVVNPVWTPLYTAPQPARQPLTDEQMWADDRIMGANSRLGLLMKDLALLARAIEAAHGITDGQQ